MILPFIWPVVVALAWPWQMQKQAPFTQPFDPAKKKIRLLPAEARGLFRQNEIMAIGTTDRAPIRVMTLRGETVYEGKPAMLPPLPVNHYFVEARGDRSQFVVLPSDYKGASFLGTEADEGSDSGYSQTLARIRPGWSRALSGGNTWADVEPQPNKWNWERLDRMVQICQTTGRKLLLTAWVRPAWQNNEGEFVARYCEYLRQLCGRYGSKIYAIEIWNEANSHQRWPLHPEYWIPFESAHEEVPAAYLKLLGASRAAIKAEAPDIRVYGAGWATPVTDDFIRKLSALGGSQYLDGFSFHDYYLREAAPDESVMLRDGFRPRIDKLVAEYRRLYPQRALLMNEGALYGQSALGIRNTQRGGDSLLSQLSWQRGMCRAIKYAVMYRAEGVQAIIPHVFPGWTDDPKNNIEIYGWEFNERGPHPKTTAVLMTCYWLEGAKLVEKRVVNDTLFLFEWARPQGQKLIVLWCCEGKERAMDTTLRAKLTDMYGAKANVGALGEEPLLVHGMSIGEAVDLLR